MALDDRHGRYDRLDALLTSTPMSRAQPGDEELEPLLAAARALGPLREAAPSATFAQSLEARLLIEAARLAAPASDAVRSLETPAASRKAPLPVPARGDSAEPFPRGKRPSRSRHLRFLWPAVAAVLLLTLGTITTAFAGPGSPLYALHRLEQTARVALSVSPADRVHLHLQYASDALAAADAAARRGDDASYGDALATLRSELDAAASELRGVGAGSEYDSLASSLAAARTRAIGDLRGDLPLLSWSQRLSTTNTLAALGDSVPHVTSATVTRVQDSGAASDVGGGAHIWRVQITGTGFASGARLLVNGQPAGTVLSESTTTLVASYVTPDGQPPTTLGIANPDSIAAQTTTIRVTPAAAGFPGASGGPAATPGGSSQGGDHGGGSNGGHGGSHGGTPTPGPRGG